MSSNRLYRRVSDEFVVNSTIVGEQRLPQIVALSGGGYVISWLDVGTQGAPGRGAVAQIFDAQGVRVGGEILLGAADLSSIAPVRLVALSNGGFAAIWPGAEVVNGTRPTVFKAFDASGVATSNTVTLNFPGDVEASDDALLLSGGRIIVMNQLGRGVVLDSAGTVLSPDISVDMAPLGGSTALAPAPGGGFLVLFFARTDLRRQLFDANGVATGPSTSLGSSPNGINFDGLSATALAGGGYVAAFSDRGGGIFLYILDAAGGTLASSAIFRPAANLVDPRFFAVADGGFMMIFNERSNSGSVTSVIKGQLFAADGTARGSEFVISVATDNLNSNHAEGEVVQLADGRFVAVWQGSGPGDPRAPEAGGITTDGGIRAQIFAPITEPIAIDIAEPLSSISEIAPAGVAVAALTSTSDAVNSTFSYEMLSDPTGGAFAIVGNRLVVANNALLDHETASAIRLSIAVTDQAGNRSVENFDIVVSDALAERRYAAGQEFRVNGTTDWSQSFPSVTALNDGYLVTWTDGSFRADGTGTAIKAQRYDSLGNAVGSEFLVNSEVSGIQDSSVAASFSDGSFVIVWSSFSGFAGTSGEEIKGQRYDATGQRVGGEFLVNNSIQNGQGDPSVTALSTGGFVVSWTDASGQGGDTTGLSIKAQRYDAAGVRIGEEFLVNTATAADQSESDIAGLPGGGFVISWTDRSQTGGDSSSTSVKAQIFDATGNRVGGEFLVNTRTLGGQQSPSVATTGSGFVITWSDSFGVRAQLFDVEGSRFGGEIVVESGVQSSVASLPGGGFAVSWRGTTGPDRDGAIRMRHFDEQGLPIGDAFTVNDSYAQSQLFPSIAVLSSGAIAAAWTDAGRNAQLIDIQTRLFTPLQPHIVGTAAADGLAGTSGGDFMFAGNGNDFLNGLVGDDALYGESGDDVLIGEAGDDLLSGGIGADQLFGGLGNDAYLVENAGDLVFESLDSGTDSVSSSVSHYLYANVENLTLTGSGNIFGVGNELANILTGNAGENLLIAGAGVDTVRGGGARDAIFGEAGDDQLFGDAGVDYIVAGIGNDSVDGGIDADEIYGQDGDDVLDGGTSFHTDIIVGGDGNDIIRGDGGQGDFDFLYGNLGNDSFYVDTPADLVFEQVGEGTDIVFANIVGAGFYLYDNIENLTLLGATPFGVGNTLANSITGNARDNFLLGGAGDDVLNGLGGGDVLFGEAGADTFIFGRGTGGDVIGDFERGVDRIDLSAFGFASFAQLQTAFIQNGNVGAINLGNGDLVVLHNVTMSALMAGDFIL